MCGTTVQFTGLSALRVPRDAPSSAPVEHYLVVTPGYGTSALSMYAIPSDGDVQGKALPPGGKAWVPASHWHQSVQTESRPVIASPMGAQPASQGSGDPPSSHKRKELSGPVLPRDSKEQPCGGRSFLRIEETQLEATGRTETVGGTLFAQVRLREEDALPASLKTRSSKDELVTHDGFTLHWVEAEPLQRAKPIVAPKDWFNVQDTRSAPSSEPLSRPAKKQAVSETPLRQSSKMASLSPLERQRIRSVLLSDADAVPILDVIRTAETSEPGFGLRQVAQLVKTSPDCILRVGAFWIQMTREAGPWRVIGRLQDGIPEFDFRPPPHLPRAPEALKISEALGQPAKVAQFLEKCSKHQWKFTVQFPQDGFVLPSSQVEGEVMVLGPAPKMRPGAAIKTARQAHEQLQPGDILSINGQSAEFVRFHRGRLVVRPTADTKGQLPKDPPPDKLRLTDQALEDFVPRAVGETTVDITKRQVFLTSVDIPTADELPRLIGQSVMLRTSAIKEATLLKVDLKRNLVLLGSPEWSTDLAFLGSQILSDNSTALASRDSVTQSALRAIKHKIGGDLVQHIGHLAYDAPTVFERPFWSDGPKFRSPKSWYQDSDGLYHYAVPLNAAAIAMPAGGCCIRPAPRNSGPQLPDHGIAVQWDRLIYHGLLRGDRRVMLMGEAADSESINGLPPMSPAEELFVYRYGSAALVGDPFFDMPLPPHQERLIACMRARDGDTVKFQGVEKEFVVRQATVQRGVGYVGLQVDDGLPAELERHRTPLPSADWDSSLYWISLAEIDAHFSEPWPATMSFDEERMLDAQVISPQGDKLNVFVASCSKKEPPYFTGTIDTFQLKSNDPIPWLEAFSCTALPPFPFSHRYDCPADFAGLRFGKFDPHHPDMVPEAVLIEMKPGTPIQIAGRPARMLASIGATKDDDEDDVNSRWISELKSVLEDAGVKYLDETWYLVGTDEADKTLAELCHIESGMTIPSPRRHDSPITTNHYYVISGDDADFRYPPRAGVQPAPVGALGSVSAVATPTQVAHMAAHLLPRLGGQVQGPLTLQLSLSGAAGDGATVSELPDLLQYRGTAPDGKNPTAYVIITAPKAMHGLTRATLDSYDPAFTIERTEGSRQVVDYYIPAAPDSADSPVESQS